MLAAAHAPYCRINTYPLPYPPHKADREGAEISWYISFPASKPRKIDAVAPTSSGSPLSSLSDDTAPAPPRSHKAPSLLNLALLALPPSPSSPCAYNHQQTWTLHRVAVTSYSGNDRLTRNDRITPTSQTHQQNIAHRMESLDWMKWRKTPEPSSPVRWQVPSSPLPLAASYSVEWISTAGMQDVYWSSSPRVPFVRTLFIDFAGAEGEHEQMIRIMHKLRNIEVLTLEYYNDLSPTFLASAMTASPALTLGDSRVVGQYVSPPPSSRPSALECLILLRHGIGTDQQRFLLHPTTSIHFRSLKRLHLHEAAGAEFCAALLSLTSPSLERLKLQCSPNALLPLFDFPRLPALRFVEFQISHVVVSRIDIIVAHMRDVAPQVEILVTHY
ncbi:hypothetical protein C8J57DRAFT_1568860 [Mycena rebaudengoi]|nr:hypothetical protein C8J57DRAFT_1568860 [Mycena rebaudengoi]